MVKYIQCLVCGRMTPTDRGVCYHCGSPLPTEMRLPLGMIICPNCLKLTPIDTGYCSHCRARLPPELIKAAKRELAKYRVLNKEYSYETDKYTYFPYGTYNYFESERSDNNLEVNEELQASQVMRIVNVPRYTRVYRVRNLHM